MPTDDRDQTTRIEPHDTGMYVLRTGGLSVVFDDITATGYGYWTLSRDGEPVARLRTLDDCPPEHVRRFRRIQCRDTDSQEVAE